MTIMVICLYGKLWGQDNYCMIGNHSIPVIVDAVLKGVAGVDAEKAYEAVHSSSIVSHPNFPFEVWEKYGYMPEDIQTQSVSITLEQAFDDWCVALLARKLGKEEDYGRFMKRSAFTGIYLMQKQNSFNRKIRKENGWSLSILISMEPMVATLSLRGMPGNTSGMYPRIYLT